MACSNIHGWYYCLFVLMLHHINLSGWFHIWNTDWYGWDNSWEARWAMSDYQRASQGLTNSQKCTFFTLQSYMWLIFSLVVYIISPLWWCTFIYWGGYSSQPPFIHSTFHNIRYISTAPTLHLICTSFFPSILCWFWICMNDSYHNKMSFFTSDSKEIINPFGSPLILWNT